LKNGQIRPTPRLLWKPLNVKKIAWPTIHALIGLANACPKMGGVHAIFYRVQKKQLMLGILSSCYLLLSAHTP